MRIVVVEDEAPIREGMAKILSKISPDYELVGKAADGESGYKMITQLQPDLVIMDIRMPKMDGLRMMKKLREEQNKCKVIVLSAYSDFNYAKKAIDLKIENYLLKPLKLPELKRALRQVEEAITEELSTEQIFSLENIFLSCIHGQMRENEQLSQKMKQKYGVSLEDPVEVFAVWLGSGYKEQKKSAKYLMESVGAHTIRFSSRVLESDSWMLLTMVIYKKQDDNSLYEYFQKSVIPMMQSHLDGPVVYLWQSVENLLHMPEIMQKIRAQREWNLIFPPGTLIGDEVIAAQNTVPLKYPAELEDRAKQLILKEHGEGVTDCFEELSRYYRQDPHTPADIKQTIIRMGWAVFNAYKTKLSTDLDLQVQKALQEVSEAVSWKQIRRSLGAFFRLLKVQNEKEAEDDNVSTMIKQAKKLIQKYYDQGITLEEIADKLYVSEEYLSTQFKKETGSTFTETVRKYRIEKVKELLINTRLKLNQIAELAGYSDPKYMSKVFKEEVGMLPTEYRKSVQ